MSAMVHRAAAIERVVIAGGGSAGWMTAAALGILLRGTGTAIELVESEDIGTVGVGEATIPPIQMFNRMIGIDEAEFMRETSATFKLGIEFADWHSLGARYFHPFGRYGDDFGAAAFHQHWLAAREAGDTSDLAEYSLCASAAAEGRFALPPRRADKASVYSTYGHAYHFDAGLYAAYLRRLAEARGVRRHEGRISGCERDGQTGNVCELVMADGRRIRGDLFVDCTGFRALLIGEALGVPFQDWSHWLPCNRALAMPTQRIAPPLPYTRAWARSAGWQWRIPLQHRTGNGLVWCSAFMDEEDAHEALLAGLDAAPLTDPRALRFTTGRRAQTWSHNVVAIGLAAGFMEPLESTNLHLIQTSISRLVQWFPNANIAPAGRTRFNQLAAREWDSVRDLLIFHYTATSREDTPFWRHCRSITLPDTLAQTIELYQTTGHILAREGDVFASQNWLAVLDGQGIRPAARHPLADTVSPAERARILQGMRTAIAQTVAAMPMHQDVLTGHYAAA